MNSLTVHSSERYDYLEEVVGNVYDRFSRMTYWLVVIGVSVVIALMMTGTAVTLGLLVHYGVGFNVGSVLSIFISCYCSLQTYLLYKNLKEYVTSYSYNHLIGCSSGVHAVYRVK